MHAVRLAYDGRGYHGYQRQPDVPTVEGELFDALRALGVLEGSADRPPGYSAAGRTDAGVSALAQTVALEGPEWLTPRALNAELPPEIRAWAAATVPSTFHATHDASRRRYVYHLYAPQSEIDDELVCEAIERLSGRLAVDNLTRASDPRPRSVTATVERDGPFLQVTVAAGGFPWEFVRRLVAVVRAVGTGDRDPRFVDRVLDPTPLSGQEALGPAPPGPLVLAGVSYDGVSFSRDPTAVESASTVFDRRRVEHLTNGRVAGHIDAGITGDDSL